MRIPEELVSLVRERRIIPFIGAGLSAGLGLPDWEELLRDVCSRLEGADFDSLMADTNGDLLQVAEYLYLRCDRHIGPIRHALERGLASQKNPLLSGIHVELVNLRAQQIYTTNYDDLIEETFLGLNLPVKTVVLPKDVALADNKRTQVVKYHGDLRHEETLVLTESAYYKRLNFESPMDLKFRSDLLGRSVLFMGYSFRDINIRIIWFRLMEMMKDIPEADRTPSYIVRAQPNEALEELYRAVGLRTIVLTDETKALSAKERTRLHAKFVMRLADSAFGDGPPPRSSKRWISAARLDEIEVRAAELEKRLEGVHFRAGRLGMGAGPLSHELKRLKLEYLPAPLKDRAAEVFGKVLEGNLIPVEHWEFAREILERLGPSSDLTGYFAKVVAAGGIQPIRAGLLASDLDWELVWSKRVSDEVVDDLVKRLETEITVHLFEPPDEDLAYVIDVIKRVLNGEIFDKRRIQKFRERIVPMLEEAQNLYPSISEYEPVAGSKPEPSSILAQISAADGVDSAARKNIRHRATAARRQMRPPT